MSTPEHILNKIKLLLNLVNNPNANEAANAQALANKLIEKHGVTQEELAELHKQPVTYSADAMLFHTFHIIGWMQHLALACAKQFYCHVVVETIVSMNGEEFNYYVYGEDNDVIYTKFAFNTFHKKINNLLDTKCIGRGEIYKNSYCEGVVEAVKSNLATFGIEIPEAKQASRSPRQEEKILTNGQANLSTGKEFKEKPEKETVDVASGSLIKDVQAYFRGLEDGCKIDL